MTLAAITEPLPDACEIHIWDVRLAVSTAVLDWLWLSLSEDEQVRARRFHFPRDRDRSVVARGALRVLLGRYLDQDPAALRFTYNKYGKPELQEGAAASGLRFNVSHAGERGLYAVTRNSEIGVDIERMRPDFATQPIAERFFSSREVTALGRLPEHLRPEAFFRCWTRKEAFIKARGEGISLGLDRFSVSLAPEDAAALVSFDSEPLEVSRWRLYHVGAEPGYAAAVAVAGREHRLSQKGWLQLSRPEGV